MNDRYEQFRQDMEGAGLAVFDYEGRGGYSGPAVRVTHYSQAAALTRVPVRHDNLGKRYVVYPR